MTEAGQRVSGAAGRYRAVILSAAKDLSAFIVVLCLISTGAAAQSLSKRLDARLDRPPFNRQLWGVALMDEGGRLIYGRNPDRLFIPASNTKLVVSAVASALLPPDCGIIIADAYNAVIFRDAPERKMNAARRKTQILRFAQTAADRLHRFSDPRL